MLERFIETDTLLTNVLPKLPLQLGGGLITLSLLFHPDIVVLGLKIHTLAESLPIPDFSEL